MRLPVLLLSLVAFLAPAVAEEPSAVDPSPIAVHIATEVVRPGYATLARAASENARAWREECAGATPSRERLATHHRALAQAWWEVEVIRFGPMVADFRAERLNFWPDRRNATTRGLAALLAPSSPEPTTTSIREASAAVQGLPTLERLIFDAATAPSGRACAVGRAVADNLRVITEEVEAEWAALAPRLASDRDFAREMVARSVTDLITGFQTLIDGKLAALGKTAETARPEGLEGRRAGLEVAALARTIAGMRRLAIGLVGDRAEGATVLATLETAAGIAADLSEPLGPLLADPRRRSRVVLLRDALRSAQDAAYADLPSLVGITVGFNSRDGD